jgi:hypothetical protein
LQLPNNSSKPTLLRYGNGGTEKRATVAFTTQRGLTQVLATDMKIVHCPSCQNPLRVGLLDFLPSRSGREVLCQACFAKSTFPLRARLAAVLSGFAALFAVAELGQRFFLPVTFDGNRTVWLIVLVAVAATSYVFVSAVICKAFGKLVLCEG